MHMQYEALATWGVTWLLLASSPPRCLGASLSKRMEVTKFKPLSNAGSDFKDGAVASSPILSTVLHESRPGYKAFQETKVLPPQVVQTEHGPATISGRINRGSMKSEKKFSDGGSSGSMTHSAAFQHTQTSFISDDLKAILALQNQHSQFMPSQIGDSVDQGKRYLPGPRRDEVTHQAGNKKPLFIEDITDQPPTPPTAPAGKNTNSKSPAKLSSTPSQYTVEVPDESDGGSIGGNMQNQQFKEPHKSSWAPNIEDPDAKGGSKAENSKTQPVTQSHAAQDSEVLGQKMHQKIAEEESSQLNLDEQIKKLQLSDVERKSLKEYAQKKRPQEKYYPGIQWSDEDMKQVYNEWKDSPKTFKFQVLNRWDKFKVQVKSLWKAFMKLIKNSKKEKTV